MFRLFNLSLEEQNKALNDKLNEKELTQNPGHGSQGNPLINVRFREEKNEMVDMRVTNPDQLRNVLLNSHVKFSERKGYQTTHATHFKIKKDDLQKVIAPEDKSCNYTF